MSRDRCDGGAHDLLRLPWRMPSAAGMCSRCAPAASSPPCTARTAAPAPAPAVTRTRGGNSAPPPTLAGSRLLAARRPQLQHRDRVRPVRAGGDRPGHAQSPARPRRPGGRAQVSVTARGCSPACVSGMASRGRSRRSRSPPRAAACTCISPPGRGCGCATPPGGWAGASTPARPAVTSSPRAASSAGGPKWSLPSVPPAPLPGWLATRLDRTCHVLARPSRCPCAGPRTRPLRRAVLDRETRRVAHARHGQRNDTLNRAAFTLGQLSRRRAPARRDSPTRSFSRRPARPAWTVTPAAGSAASTARSAPA